MPNTAGSASNTPMSSFGDLDDRFDDNPERGTDLINRNFRRIDSIPEEYCFGPIDEAAEVDEDDQLTSTSVIQPNSDIVALAEEVDDDKELFS